MRAVVIKDGGIVIEERPDPEPGAGEALVKVHAAGLNGADILQRAGLYPPPAGVPADMPGMELAGEIIANGPGRDPLPGWRAGDGPDRRRRPGGARGAERAHADGGPRQGRWAAAGGLPEVFTTAHDALFTQCALQSGERLLVHGAAGGVGTAAVQLGRAAGARVTATVRNPEHRAERGLAGRLRARPREFVDEGPYDVILELVGAPNMPDNLRALQTHGRISVIGTSAGAAIEINLGLLMARRGCIHGSTLRGRALEEKALTARAVERSVLPLFARRNAARPARRHLPDGRGRQGI